MGDSKWRMKSDFSIQGQASPHATRVTIGMLHHLPKPQCQYQQNEDAVSPYLLRMLEGGGGDDAKCLE